MRNKILDLLKEKEITKAQMARDLDFSRTYIDLIVRAKNNGSYKFWRKFQEVYKISDDQINEYKKVEN